MICFVMTATIRVGTDDHSLLLKEGEVYAFYNALVPEGRKLIIDGHAKEIRDPTKMCRVNLSELGAKINAPWN